MLSVIKNLENVLVHVFGKVILSQRRNNRGAKELKPPQGRRQKIFQGGWSNGKKDRKLAKNTEK